MRWESLRGGLQYSKRSQMRIQYHLRHLFRRQGAYHPHLPTPTRGVFPSALHSRTLNHPSRTNKLFALTLMSQTYPTAASSSSSSSNFQLMIDNALNKYKQRTKNDLRAHPLAAQLESCDSPSAILAVLQEQVLGLDQSRSADERWTKWLGPTVNVLYAFSSSLGSGVSLVCLRTCPCLRFARSCLCGSSSPLRV